jgi:hypothetical protein
LAAQPVEEIAVMLKVWAALKDMRIVVWLFGLVVTGGILLGYGLYLWLQRTFPLPSSDIDPLRVQYFEQYVRVIQIVAAGVTVTLLTATLPLILPEARDRYERYKESRDAYSRAKTAVIYLPDRVVGTNRERGFDLVQEAHRALHLAETFENVIIQKGYLDWFDNPRLWTLYNYWQIVAVAEVLRSAHTRGPVDDSVLRVQLKRTLATVHDRFGHRGERVKGENWNRVTRFAEEDKLERQILEQSGTWTHPLP